MAESGLDPTRVPTSPTGRVPRWVLDEAVGRLVDSIPMRAGHPSPLRGRSRLALRVVAAAALIAVAAAATVAFDRSTSTPPAPTAAEPAAAEPVSGAPRTAPPAGLEESAAPLGAPADAPALLEGQGFRFLSHDPAKGLPITWSPCRPVHFVTRPDQAPAWGHAVIADAVARVSAATGLRFVDDGPTTEAPSPGRRSYQPGRYGDRWAPVLLAWATPTEVPDFGLDIIGEAGPAAETSTTGRTAFVSGTLYLDAAKLAGLHTELGEGAARAVVLHELGHLVGLDHIDAPEQIMFPRSSTAATEFGAGDRAGLAALGRGPCQPDL